MKDEREDKSGSERTEPKDGSPRMDAASATVRGKPAPAEKPLRTATMTETPVLTRMAEAKAGPPLGGSTSASTQGGDRGTPH